MALVVRPAMSDDSGLFTDGTVLNEAFIGALLDEVDDQAHSVTNPTVKPKATTDEVVTARGNLASLDARLSGVVDDDGNPVAAAGQATETQVARAEGNFNLVSNPDLEDWAAGAAAAPDDFTLSGVGAVVARTGSGEADTQDLGTGTYAAKITSGGGAAAKFTQQVITSADYSKYRSLDGRKVGFTLRALVALSNVLRIVVDDGATTTVSSYATGSGSEQDIPVVHTISASATKLDVYAEVALGTNTAYVGGFTLVVSDLAPAAWTPLWARFRQNILDEAEPETGIANGITVKIGGMISSQVDDKPSSGTGETDAHAYTLPANALVADGDMLILRASGSMDSNSNAKTVKFYFEGTAYTVMTSSATGAGWDAELWIIRRTSTTAWIVPRIGKNATAAVASSTPVPDAAVDFTVTIAIKSTVQMGTSGTITETVFSVELKPAP